MTTLAQRLRRLLRVGAHGAVTVVHVASVDRDMIADRNPRTFVNVGRGPEGGAYQCPCCSSVTLPERGAYELCPVCYWEDDGQDDHDADQVRGGPNGSLSLTQARANYVAFGACHRTFLGHVRPPEANEHPNR